MKKMFLFFLYASFLLVSCGDDGTSYVYVDSDADETGIDWYEAANSSSTSLIKNFWNSTYSCFNYSSTGNLNFNYWPQAHALDVLVDAYTRTGDSSYDYFDEWYDGVKAMNGGSFWNEYYDDMEWNALAMLRVYQATGEEKFKEAAQELWGYIQQGWNDNAGGGITWKRGMEYSKNACSNGPACILAARLYQEFGDEEDKQWALDIYSWEKSTLFNSNNGMVYDNINSNTNEIQENIYTYNQGTFIGSAVELYKIMGEKGYLNDAVLAADYAIGSMVSNSILKSEGTGDGGLFKGIFIRYLTELIQQDRLSASDQRRYLQSLELNAETLWTEGTSQTYVLFGPDWTTSPGSSTGLTEHLSGCMLIEAAALLESLDLL